MPAFTHLKPAGQGQNSHEHRGTTRAYRVSATLLSRPCNKARLPRPTPVWPVCVGPARRYRVGDTRGVRGDAIAQRARAGGRLAARQRGSVRGHGPEQKRTGLRSQNMGH
jgi:hypothetical protein